MAAGETLKRYFLNELGALRRQSTQFAKDFPAVAKELALAGVRSQDPHVELLLQSFAFLAGQLRYAMDLQDAALPDQLTEALNPQLACPLPSMAVLKLTVGAADGNFAKPLVLPAHTEFSPEWRSGRDELNACRFATAEAVEVWPLKDPELASVPVNQTVRGVVVPPLVRSVLQIRIGSKGPPLSGMDIRRLRFYLSGPNAYAWFDCLSRHAAHVVAVDPRTGIAYTLPNDSLRFACVDGAPFPSGEATPHPGLALLRVYFACPERFRFFTVENLPPRMGSDELNLYIYFTEACPPVLENQFSLNCVSIVNLYRQRLEPFRLQSGKSEYPLYGDRLHHATCEVHSIESLALFDDTGINRPVAPLYADHGNEDAFWTVRREVSQYPSIAGTETQITVLDRNIAPLSDSRLTVGGTAWCTNRRLAEQLRAGDALEASAGAGVRGGDLVTSPSPHRTPHLIGQGVQRLCIQLSDQVLPLEGGAAALQRFQDLLLQHVDPRDPVGQQQVGGIKELWHARTAERTGKEVWHGMSTGIDLTLKVDMTQYADTSALLLGEVLSECFARFAPVNGFVRLCMVDDRDTVLKRWPLRSRAVGSV